MRIESRIWYLPGSSTNSRVQSGPTGRLWALEYLLKKELSLEYATRWSNYRIRVTDADLKRHEDLFRRLINEARAYREG